MRFDPDLQHRQSIRFPKMDYSRTGLYFVTICTHDRVCLLGEIEKGDVRLTYAGRTVQSTWDDLPKHYPHVTLDAFVVMPNHVHGILGLRELDPASAPRHPLGEVVRALKSFSARRINRRRESPGAPVWQRNYYERIIRDENELEGIRRYIADNPSHWAGDPENPILHPIERVG
ncbi:MAG TPA: transposase [Thermoanaerobaculia bacterium]|nr:transposase [Thermoanaerobaculia bacterium]